MEIHTLLKQHAGLHQCCPVLWTTCHWLTVNLLNPSAVDFESLSKCNSFRMKASVEEAVQFQRISLAGVCNGVGFSAATLIPFILRINYCHFMTEVGATNQGLWCVVLFEALGRTPLCWSLYIVGGVLVSELVQQKHSYRGLQNGVHVFLMCCASHGATLR